MCVGNAWVDDARLLVEPTQWLPLPTVRIVNGLSAAQAALLFLGYQPGDPDGVAGQNTRKALIAFRRDAQSGSSEQLDDAVFEALLSRAGLR